MGKLIDRILVPIDFGSTTKDVLRYAASLHDRFGSKLTLLHCYDDRVYNRKYDFGHKPYQIGIVDMLAGLASELALPGLTEAKYLAVPGSAVETIAKLSARYQLIVQVGHRYGSTWQRFLGSHTSYIASTAKCPVLIIPPDTEYRPWLNVWHINRGANEAEIIERFLDSFGIEKEALQVKSFQQQEFTSSFWRSAVNYVTNPSSRIKRFLEQSFEEDPIDLMLLVSHDRALFQKFLKDELKQVIFSFGVPLLIFQAPKAKWKIREEAWGSRGLS